MPADAEAAELHPEPRSTAPTAVRVVVGIVLVEVLALVAVSGVLVVNLLTHDAAVGLSLGLVVFALAVAALLVAGSRGLLHGRRIGRAPVMTWQLFQIVLGVGALQAGNPLWGIPLLALAGVAMVGLVLRTVVEHTTS